MSARRSLRRCVRAGLATVLVAGLVTTGAAWGESPPPAVAAAAGPVSNGMIAAFAWRSAPPGSDPTHISDDLDLVVMRADGTGAQVLVPGAVRRSVCGFDLDWSPDGNWIAWAGKSQVWVARADGTDARKLADGCVSHLDWAPDGSTLAVDIDHRMGVLTVATGAFRWLNDCPFWQSEGTFSPDGSTLVVVGVSGCDGSPNGWGIYGLDVATGQMVARYADTNLRGQPPHTLWAYRADYAEWHPSQGTVLVGFQDGQRPNTCHPLGQDGYYFNSDLYTVAAASGSEPVKITNTSGEYEMSETDATWSPDGQRILFTGTRNLTCIGSNAYTQAPVELYVMNSDGSGVQKIWSPWNPTLGFVASSWQPCTPATVTCVPPPDSDGDGVPDAGDACPAVPGPVGNQGCPVPPTPDPAPDPVPAPAPEPGPGAEECQGLSRSDVLGDHLKGKKLSSFPNSDTMCSGLMLKGAGRGFVPQGLALASAARAWVTGYLPRTKVCWVLKVDLHSGAVLRRQEKIRAGKDSCSHAGGAMLNADGLWVADTHHLWLLDPRKIGKPGVVVDHWALHTGKKDHKSLKGSFLLDGQGRLGLGQYGKKAGKILMFRYAALRKKSAHTLVARGPAGKGEVAPSGSLDARKRAQGAEWGPNGGLYVAASKSTCGLIDHDSVRTYGFGPGVEEFEFASPSRVWAVFEASAKKYHAKSGLVVPMLAEFDAKRLFAPGAAAGSC